MSSELGRKQISILRTVHGGRWFDTAGYNSAYRACLRLHARRLLARDTSRGSRRFTSTAGGDRLIEAHDDAIAALLGEKTA